MAISRLITPDGKTWSGAAHPEIAQPSEEILRRDLRLMKKHRCSCFVRLPYADLKESDLIRAQNAVVGGKSVQGAIVAVQVFHLYTDTNARVALTAEMAAKPLDKGVRDLRPRDRKGFGGTD
jgi:hypothetical protein